MAMTFTQKFTYRMMRLMVRMMPSCKDISALISKSMERELPWHKRATIRLHVMMCSYCRRYEKQLSLLRKGASLYGDPEKNQATPGLSSESKERIRRALIREFDSGS